jgi:hypothetical protein
MDRTVPKGAALSCADKYHAYRPLLDLIGFTEETDKGRGYNETLAYGKMLDGKVTKGNPQYRTQSEQNDYFGWLDFYPPRPGLIEEVATGGRLTVIVSDHALVLDIAGAHDQFAKFLACRGEQNATEVDEACE